MTPPVPFLKGVGPALAKIVIVTDFATADDLWKGYPLAGIQGNTFNEMLHEAGIIRAECYITSVLKTRPAKDSVLNLFSQNKAEAGREGLHKVINGTYVHLSLPEKIAFVQQEVSARQPTVIVAVGPLAMFALTEVYGSVDTWRGSHLTFISNPSVTVIPTYPVSDINKRWEIRPFAIRDLQRVEAVRTNPQYYTYPAYKFQIRPTFSQVMKQLWDLRSQALRAPLWLSCDVETIARQLSCIGIAWSAREAICIPMLTLGGNYFPVEQEVAIQQSLRKLLTHPNTKVIGQNFNYDNQHFAKHLGYLPNLTFDTMLAQHALFPGIPKSLDFLSSMYCHWHRYWKDEMDDYSRLPDNLDQYWTYNCKDCVTTFEIRYPLQDMLQYMNREPQFEFLMRTGVSALRTMLRGVRIDKAMRSKVAEDLMKAIAQHEALIQKLVGFPLNVGSPPQMVNYFYNELKLPVQRNRKTGRPTVDAKAMPALIKAEPLLGPLFQLIERKRSLGVFLNTFCRMPLSEDGRMRCTFNVGGTETFRLSSSTDAFGTGGNLQNIPKGDEDA